MSMLMILSIYFLKLAVCSSFGVENLCLKQIGYWKQCKNYGGGGGGGFTVFVVGVDFYFNSCAWFS